MTLSTFYHVPLIRPKIHKRSTLLCEKSLISRTKYYLSNSCFPVSLTPHMNRDKKPQTFGIKGETIQVLWHPTKLGQLEAQCIPTLLYWYILHLVKKIYTGRLQHQKQPHFLLMVPIYTSILQENKLYHKVYAKRSKKRSQLCIILIISIAITSSITKRQMQQ